MPVAPPRRSVRVAERANKPLAVPLPTAGARTRAQAAAEDALKNSAAVNPTQGKSASSSAKKTKSSKAKVNVGPQPMMDIIAEASAEKKTSKTKHKKKKKGAKKTVNDDGLARAPDVNNPGVVNPAPVPAEVVQPAIIAGPAPAQDPAQAPAPVQNPAPGPPPPPAQNVQNVELPAAPVPAPVLAPLPIPLTRMEILTGGDELTVEEIGALLSRPEVQAQRLEIIVPWKIRVSDVLEMNPEIDDEEIGQLLSRPEIQAWKMEVIIPWDIRVSDVLQMDQEMDDDEITGIYDWAQNRLWPEDEAEDEDEDEDEDEHKHEHEHQPVPQSPALPQTPERVRTPGNSRTSLQEPARSAQRLGQSESFESDVVAGPSKKRKLGSDSGSEGNRAPLAERDMNVPRAGAPSPSASPAPPPDQGIERDFDENAFQAQYGRNHPREMVFENRRLLWNIPEDGVLHLNSTSMSTISSFEAPHPPEGEGANSPLQNVEMEDDANDASGASRASSPAASQEAQQDEQRDDVDEEY